jgi:hypothetical protein
VDEEQERREPTPQETQNNADTRNRVCVPTTRQCLGNTVKACNGDGSDFSIETCGLGETCSVAACVPIADTCATEQPFELSANEIAFEASRHLKTQTRQVRLTNCSAEVLLLRDAVVRGPARPDGEPVFRLLTEVSQARIEAGSSIDIALRYSPAPGVSSVTGRLELSLVSRDLVNVQIGLRSRSECTAITPFLDFGVVENDDLPRDTIVVQNCGTEPLELSGWQGPTFVAFDPPPDTQLLPGDELTVGVRTVGDLPPLLDAQAKLSTAVGAPAELHTSGLRVTEPACAPHPIGEPRLFSNNSERPPTPDDLVRLYFPDTDARLMHWVELIEQPEMSSRRLERTATGWTFRPRVVGRYRAAIQTYDVFDRTISCDTTEFEFEVKPRAGLHVELAWLTNGDGIVDDVGFGRAANLDLHVLSTDGDTGVWNDQANDCFPGVTGPCGAAQGSVAVSQGGIAELVHFDQATGLFEVGVYLSNPFNFTGAIARVRVYEDGLLVGELESRPLQSANDFWLVGRWDASSRAWTEIDRVFAGFPM